MLVVAVVLPGVIIGRVKSTITDILPIKDKATFDERFGEFKDSVDTYHLFNCTNALAVQEGRAKPKFNMVTIKLLCQGKRYNVDFNSDKSQVDYSTWSSCDVHPDYKEVYENAPLIIVNPQLASGVYSRFGTEWGLYYGIAGFALEQIASGIFLNEQSGIPVAFKIFSIGVYLNGIQSMVQSTKMFNNSNQIALQWAGIPQISGHLTLAESQAGTGLELGLEGFEIANVDDATRVPLIGIGGALREEQALLLWNPEEKYSLFSGQMAWMNFLLCCVSNPGMPAFTACFNPGSDGAGIAEALISDKDPGGTLSAMAVAAWLGQITSSQIYLDICKTTLTYVVPQIADAESWADVGALQWGSGALTKLMFGAGSVLATGALPAAIKVAPELSDYAEQQGTTAGRNGHLSIKQSRAFLATFADQTNCETFLAATESVKEQPTAATIEGLLNLVNSWPDMGFYLDPTDPTDTNAHLWHDYLLMYLPIDLFLASYVRGGPMDRDGIYPSNSGLFTRRTPKELIEGWDDPVALLVESTTKFDGLMGSVIRSDPSEVRDAKPDFNPNSNRYGKFTGNDDVKKTNDIAMWQGLTEFHRRDAFPGSENACTNSFTTVVAKDPETCFVWKDETKIAGQKDAIWGEPFDGLLTPTNFQEVQGSATKGIWSGAHMREIIWERTGSVEVQGVFAEQYRFSKDAILNDCTAPNHTTPCNPANANFWMDKGDNIWPMQTSRDGAAVTVSWPYFLNNVGDSRKDVRDCFDFEGSGLPTEFDEATLGTYIRVEPLSGRTIEGFTRIQLNFNLHKSIWNAGPHELLYQGTGCDYLPWPYLIFDGGAALTAEDAKIFTQIYTIMSVTRIVQIGAYILFALLLLVAAPVARCAWTAKRQAKIDALENPPAAAVKMIHPVLACDIAHPELEAGNSILQANPPANDEKPKEDAPPPLPQDQPTIEVKTEPFPTKVSL